MSFRAALNQTVVIKRFTVGVGTGYGGAPTGSDVSTTTVGRLITGRGSETQDGVIAGVEKQKLLLLPGTNIEARDRVTVDGVAFEIVGQPIERRGRIGAHHIVADVRRTGS